MNQINFAHKKKEGTCEFAENLHTKQGDFAHSKKAIKDAKQSKAKSDERKNKTNKQQKDAEQNKITMKDVKNHHQQQCKLM